MSCFPRGPSQALCNSVTKRDRHSCFSQTWWTSLSGFRSSNYKQLPNCLWKPPFLWVLSYCSLSLIHGFYCVLSLTSPGSKENTEKCSESKPVPTQKKTPLFRGCHELRETMSAFHSSVSLTVLIVSAMSVNGFYHAGSDMAQWV